MMKKEEVNEQNKNPLFKERVFILLNLISLVIFLEL